MYQSENEGQLIESSQYRNDQSNNQLYGSTYNSYSSRNQNQIIEVVNTQQQILNIADLPKLSINDIVNHLKSSFDQKHIYLEFGHKTLLLLNPYEETPHLNDEKIQNCKKYFLNKNNPLYYPPHIYKMAELALQSCFSQNNIYNRSSIIAQGISGSGKTVASKSVISYLAAESQSGLYISQDLQKVDIEERLISSSYIFEAFGNAKTKTNSNSSRFGKIVSIQFEKQKKIIGAKITTTLFERTRVTQKGYRDRNYHIFYQLKAAYQRSKELKNFASQASVKYDIVKLVKEIENFQLDSEFVLLNVQNNYTSNFDELSIKQEEQKQANEDFENFKILLQSFGDLNFSLEEIINILQCVAGLIHFQEDNYEKAEQLLKIPNLKETINSNITNQLLSKKVQAESIVNGIIMDFYFKLFLWIQNKVNQDLSQVFDPNKKFILNVFDSFGFEVIENELGIQQNQLEQLILNYINEKLQNYFYIHLIQNAEEIFTSENLQPISASFEKNDRVITLIEDVFFTSLRDCHLLSRSTENLKEIITKKSNENFLQAYFIDEAQLKTKKQNLTQSQNLHKFEYNIIGIRHTGGEVYYQIEGFLSRNKYSVSENLQNINRMSTNSIINQFEPQSQNQTISENTLMVTKDMIQILKQSDTWFAKCLQTNNLQQPRFFDQNSILTQLKQSGIDLTAQFLSQTYYLSIPNQEFFKNYQILCPNINNEQDLILFLNQQNRELCQQIYYGQKQTLIKSQLKKILDNQKQEIQFKQQLQPYLRTQQNEQHEEIIANYQKALKELTSKLEIIENEAKYQKQRADIFEANQNKYINQILQLQTLISQMVQTFNIQYQNHDQRNQQAFGDIN